MVRKNKGTNIDYEMSLMNQDVFDNQESGNLSQDSFPVFLFEDLSWNYTMDDRTRSYR